MTMVHVGYYWGLFHCASKWSGNW